MQLPELKIGKLLPRFPIIQGGMYISVSTDSLSAAVARAGGIGVLGATGISLEQLKQEITRARALADSGIIGVNIMYAARQFTELVETAISQGIDVIFTGAGFSREIFRRGQESDTPIVPIVSSARAALLAEKSGAAAVVAEGAEAGGHLGTDRSIKDILPEIKKAVKIPVIAAGGIVDGYDMAEVVKLGADGVQMVLALCSVKNARCDEYKRCIFSPGRRRILIKSPVGLPGRALKNLYRFASGR